MFTFPASRELDPPASQALPMRLLSVQELQKGHPGEARAHRAQRREAVSVSGLHIGVWTEGAPRCSCQVHSRRESARAAAELI